jgi:hypothetical protein
MSLQSSGNVGIGTTSPANKLDVNGETTIRGNLTFDTTRTITSNAVGTFLLTNPADAGIIELNAGTTSAYKTKINVYGRGNGNGITFTTQDVERMRISDAGNVGIGITTPGAQLVVGTQSSGIFGSGVAGDNSLIARFGARNDGLRVVGATIANTAPATVANDATISFIVAGNFSATGLISTILQNSSTAVSDMTFSVYDGSSNPERMRISGVAGNVGIGTTNPGRRLEVLEGNVQIVANFQNTSTTSARIKFTDANTGAENVNIGAIGTRMAMWTNNVERISIPSGGNVGIGVTNPAAKLHVSGTLRVDNVGSAPSANNGNAISRYYGTDESYYLSEPNAWLAINVGGTAYVVPLYS